MLRYSTNISRTSVVDGEVLSTKINRVYNCAQKSVLDKCSFDLTFTDFWMSHQNIDLLQKRVFQKLNLLIMTEAKKHSWSKFKIVLVRKPGRKFYYFMAKCQGSGFSFLSLNQNIKVVVFPSHFWFQKFKVVVFPSHFWFQNFKVVVFPSNFWKTTIIWQFLEWFWIFLRNVITSKIKWE